MFKLFKRMCKQIMNVTCKTVEKLFKDEDLRKCVCGGMIGFGVLGLLPELKKIKRNNKISIGLSIVGVGMSIIVSEFIKE